MRLRPFSTSSIQYIIIQKYGGIEGSIQFSTNPTNFIFNVLAHFPRDFMQFYNQRIFFETATINDDVNPAINLLIFDDTNFQRNLNPLEGYSQIYGLRDRPVVYFIDANCQNEKAIIKSIERIEHKVWYYSLYGNIKVSHKTLSKNHYFRLPIDLIKLFKRDFNIIKYLFISRSSGYKELEFIIDNDENLFELYNFNPLISNYFTLTQISNNYWKIKYPKTIETPKDEIRNDILLNSVKEIDKIHLALYEKLNIKDKYPILILTFPFYNPDLKNLLDSNVKSKTEKLYAKLYSIEQSKDYLHYFEVNEDSEGRLEKIVLDNFIQPKVRLLDSIAYLHSTFTFSPTIRFPLIGKSIYKELSYFNPTSQNFVSQKSKNNKFVSIRRFGEKLAELTLTENTIDYLIKRNASILAISDLPVEWLVLDSIPLGFTHDVCRIQESNYRGIINNYSASNKISITINKDSIKKTLIILSADENGKFDHEFRASYQLIKKQSKSLGFQYRYCKSINDISDAVRAIEPEILIFDCHGNVDNNNNLSYLVINEDRLYGKDIVENRISAPIVFLSCCNTNPNFGYMNKLHDAFFQAGAITVTGTFLPISIQRGTLYYVRLLNLLNKSYSQNLFTNWLTFISHVMRSSIIHDAFIKADKKLKRPLSNEEAEILSNLILETHIFKKRGEIFKKLINGGIKISDDLNITINDTECEFLMYSHYGRPDLIKFGS